MQISNIIRLKQIDYRIFINYNSNILIMSELSREFGIRLKTVFLEKGAKANTFSEKLGKSKSTVSTYLTGKSFPNDEFFDLLNNEFPDINLHWLITGRGDKYLVDKWQDPNARKFLFDMIDSQNKMIEIWANLGKNSGEDPSLAKFVDVYGTGDLIIGYNTLKERVAYC